MAADAADYKKGARLRRGLCRRVVSPQGKRLTMICASLVLLQIMFAVHRFAQGATALRAEGDGGALRARILKKRGAPSVISTKAGQPPIGKPLIVQARGQLRLTWRLYAESPQSGEISRPHGTGSIGLGDLSTQSFIEAVPL